MSNHGSTHSEMWKGVDWWTLPFEVILELVGDRQAQCTSCKRTRDSSDIQFGFLPHFDYRGKHSKYDVDMCTCGYYRVAHVEHGPFTGAPGITDHEFEEHGPFEYDSYYCGCKGWD